MALKGAEQIILFDAFFIFLLSTYGVGTSTTSVSAFSAIPVPQLAPLPGKITCASWDFLCNSGKDIVQATAYVGWAIVNLPVIGVYFLLQVITFLDFVLRVVFDPSFSPNGVPFLGFAFIAAQIIVLFEVFRMFRGSASGL